MDHYSKKDHFVPAKIVRLQNGPFSEKGLLWEAQNGPFSNGLFQAIDFRI